MNLRLHSAFRPADRLSQAVGPIDQNSADARRALSTSLEYLGERVLPGLEGSRDTRFAVRTMERDELGMTHVRLDRLYKGVKVFPEQVITHLSPNGRVQRLTGQL